MSPPPDYCRYSCRMYYNTTGSASSATYHMETHVFIGDFSCSSTLSTTRLSTRDHNVPALRNNRYTTSNNDRFFHVCTWYVASCHSRRKCKDRLCINMKLKRSIHFRPEWCTAVSEKVNPFSTAVPLWRQATYDVSDLSPKWGCSPKMVNGTSRQR